MFTGVAGEDIQQGSICYFGGSSDSRKLVTIIQVDNNFPPMHSLHMVIDSISYGDYLLQEDYISIINNNLHKNNKECFVSDRVATGTAYASSFVTIFAASFSFNERLALGGFIIGLATFAYNVYFKERVLKDERSYKQALLAELKNKEVVNVVQNISDTIED